ncbi:MAG: ribosomal protein S18-alanine N-acetyltransferase [Caldicoprobacterales bacterium]|jgi:ribosomal-protein-alanine N-acetyltransferase|nr:ribosomal protein S18-alanine N-acetyltransferase [Clostridiales bacterium]
MTQRIRPMTTEDVEEVSKLERLCFPTPWSQEAFRIEVERNRCARYFVVSDNSKLIGYGGMWLVVDEAHITNIAVHPDHRRQGTGRLIMKTLIEEAVRLGMTRMTLEVRVSNKAAINLYQSLGFEKGGLRKGYYANDGEDALIMWNFHIGG